jgi:hypothetical protein
MTSNLRSHVPLNAFLLPGTIAVTDAALAVAKGFEEAVSKVRPDVNWVVMFDWWDDWSANGLQQPPRLGMSAREAENVPAGVTQTLNGVTFAVEIPREVYDAAKEKKIDVTGDGSTQVELK